MAGKPYTDEFERFWKLYPARWNHNLGCYVKRKKRPAFDKWQKLSPEIRAECFAKSKYIKRSEGTPRDCVTWINEYGWEDIEIAVPKPIVSAEQAHKMFNQVPQGDKRSTSDKANEQKDKLKIR